jgi:hypothetical protein|tara:strand:- start:18 stop:332 length:315 start_codon:yes stop_codon:yes gene_type:complete
MAPCLEREQVLADGVGFYLCKMLHLLRLAEPVKQMQHLSVVFDGVGCELRSLAVYQKRRNLSFQMNLLIQKLYSHLVFCSRKYGRISPFGETPTYQSYLAELSR